MSDDRSSSGAEPSERDVRSLYPPHTVHADEYLVPLAGAAIASAVFAAANAIIGPLALSPTLCAIVAMQGLAAILLGVAAAMTKYRAGVMREALAMAEMKRLRTAREASEDEESRSIFTRDDEPTEEDAEPVATGALTTYARTVQPILLIALCLGVAAMAVIALWKTSSETAATVFFTLGAVNLAATFLSMVGARWFAEQDPELLPETDPISTVMRATQWYSVLGALALFAHGIRLYAVDLWTGRVLLVVVLALAGEQVGRAALTFIGGRRKWDEIRAPIGLLVAESLFAGANPIVGTLEAIERRFGVSVRSSYVLSYMRTVVPLILIAMVAVFWMMSCLVQVAPYEVGVLTRFGKLPYRGWFGPGLHLKLPWPIDHVQTVPAGKVQTFTIGYEAEEAKPYILWAKKHVKEEYKLVLGRGRELVSMDAMVYYRIKDPIAYLFNVQNPDEAIESLAYRVLTQRTVRTNLDQLLSADRYTLSDHFKRAMQKQVDAHNLGIEILNFPLRGIHPPIDVAKSYQGVVSAQIEKVTFQTKARARRAELLPAANADKLTNIKGAEAFAAGRLGNARGGAYRFRQIQKAYAEAPRLYRFRTRLETLDEVIPHKDLYIVESGAEKRLETWVDMREGSRLP